MNPSDTRRVFDLGARLGSLEGYLYVGKDVEAEYLPGWLNNIERHYRELPTEVQTSVVESYYEVARKVAAYLQKLYGEDDANTRKAKAMVAAAERKRSA